MPKGPRGEKRPGDVIGAAVVVGKIATGELSDKAVNYVRSKAGKAGAAARAGKMSDSERSTNARRAAESRWKKSSRQQD
jgi:hypothetical protein